MLGHHICKTRGTCPFIVRWMLISKQKKPIVVASISLVLCAIPKVTVTAGHRPPLTYRWVGLQEYSCELILWNTEAFPYRNHARKEASTLRPACKTLFSPLSSEVYQEPPCTCEAEDTADLGGGAGSGIQELPCLLKEEHQGMIIFAKFLRTGCPSHIPSLKKQNKTKWLFVQK